MTTELHLDEGDHLYVNIENYAHVNGNWPAAGVTLTTRSSLPPKYVAAKEGGKCSPRVPIHGRSLKGVFCKQQTCPSVGDAAGEAQIVAFDVPLERSNLCLLLQQWLLTSSLSL